MKQIVVSFLNIFNINLYKKNNNKPLRLQFYVIEADGNGFRLDAFGNELYAKTGMGPAWIGYEKDLSKQLKFISECYKNSYGVYPNKVLAENYEGRDF